MQQEQQQAKQLHSFRVGYCEPDPITKNYLPLESFFCSAEDREHAKEQCENAYPTSVVLFVWRL